MRAITSNFIGETVVMMPRPTQQKEFAGQAAQAVQSSPLGLLEQPHPKVQSRDISTTLKDRNRESRSTAKRPFVDHHRRQSRYTSATICSS
jgi:hypothetical protein